MRDGVSGIGSGEATVVQAWRDIVLSGEANYLKAALKSAPGRDFAEGDQAWLSGTEDAIGNGGLSAVQAWQDIALSEEAWGGWRDVYAGWGQLPPTDAELTVASTAMYNLSRAWVIVRGQSGDQLAGEAAGYQAVGLGTDFQNIVAHIAFSEDIATEILADALVTPLMDGAVSSDDVRALAAQGGSAVLDAAADQVLVRAAGKYLDGHAPDPCDDVDLFRSVHTVAVQNSDIAAANVAANSIPAYRNGIVWSSENKSTAWYDRIRQQGLPYEPYVTQQLGGGYVQLQPNFPVFDQWNEDAGIAVSDKVVDTAGTSYQQYPDTIAARMLAWGEKMVMFEDGGGKDATNFEDNDITSYSLYMAVRDVETTDAEWQAICEGYHALMAFIPAESGGKQISITIHRVS